MLLFVWSPHTIRSINKSEPVQRWAACYVMSDYNRYSSVNNMISALGWKSLKQRHRNILTICIFYKIFNGLVDVVPPEHLTPIASYPATRAHQKKFCQISTRIDAYKFSFFPRVVNLWKSPLNDIVNAPNFDLFNYYINNIVTSLLTN